MKKKSKVTKLNDKDYANYIKRITNGESVSVPEISDVKKD